MRIHIVNPNTTESMTAKAAAAALRVAAPGTTIVASTSEQGPSSIEGYVDGAYSLPGLLDRIAEADDDNVDAHIIACFDDTGLDAARALARAPVIGISEAAFHLAGLVAHSFSVVTTLSLSIPILENNLVRYGFADRCINVRAAEVPVLDLEDPATPARERLSAEIATALCEDGCEAVVLGCAGMADLAEALAQRHGVPVIEGVASAIKLCEALVTLGLSTSRLGGWAPPRPKVYKGRGPMFGALAAG